MAIGLSRRHRRISALLGVLALTCAVGCSDLLDNQQADAVIVLEAGDKDALLRTRQEVLASASTWSGTRVSEHTRGADETALEFALPGGSLDTAISALDRLEAPIVATRIDVALDQIDRTPTTLDDEGNGPDPAERMVRLRVEVTEVGPAGVGVVFRMVMAVFSLIGMAATGRWIVQWWRQRGERSRPPRRRIDRVDFRDDPPTEETPRVPPQW